MRAPTYRDITAQAIPIILANATEPLLGLVDTAVIGHTGVTADLGGIAIGTLIFSFLYWGFGFLRMGTTGFVAQALGAQDAEGIRVAVGRALILAIVIGLLMVMGQQAIGVLAFEIMKGSPAVHKAGQAYFHIRIWGAPATFFLFVIFGTLIGHGKNGSLLKLQLLLNGTNILLDVVFALFLHMGVRGIALGTVLAEYLVVGVGMMMVYRLLRPNSGERLWPWPKIMDAKGFRHTLATNTDIMIRTLFLLAGFGWFTNQGAGFGDTILAANDILLQLISFSAFFLDGFAYVVESFVGQTLGARRIDLLKQTIVRSTILAAATASSLGLLVLVFGQWLIPALAPIESVIQVAGHHLPFVAIYIALSFAAYQLDGIFIGTTHGPEMRNSAIVSFGLFVPLSLWWMHLWSNAGLWLAFIAFVVIRACTLLFYLPRVLRYTRTPVPDT